ncbi:MAG: hypothetical protein AAGI08_04725 [Bacteroidota bacterium]
MRFSSLLSAGLLAVACLFVAGCDAEPGLDEPTGSPPLLSDFELTPQQVLFDSLPENQRDGDTAIVEYRVTLQARDADADIDTVAYLINSPFEQGGPIARGELQLMGRVYTGGGTLRLPKSDTGLYTVIAYAVDSEGQLSNQVRGLIEFSAEAGAAPVIESVEAPETVTRPASGQTTRFRIVATVSDADGLRNILRVVLRTAGGTELAMLDDGGVGSNSGDETANDGRYTLTVEVSSENALGPNTFQFQAFDRQGLESNIVERTITIVE